MYLIWKGSYNNRKISSGALTNFVKQRVVIPFFLFFLPVMYVSALNFAFSNIKRAYHGHFSEVNRRQSPCFRRIRKKTLTNSVFLIKMADRVGLTSFHSAARALIGFADRDTPSRFRW